MTETASTSSGPSRFMPIVVTMAALGLLGAVGLWRDTSLQTDVAGVGFTLTAGAVWLVYGALFVTAIVALQRYGHRPPWAIALAVLWGGFLAVDVAGRANTAVITLAANLSGAFEPTWPTWLTGPLIEELLKALGIVLIALIPVSRRFGVLDGIFYGAVVGASFQVVEDFTFAVAGVSDSPTDPTQALVNTFFLRGVLGLFSHVVYSALVGAAIGWVAGGAREGRGRRLLLAAAAFLGVAALHGWLNWSAIAGLIVPHLVVSVVAASVLVWVTLRARRSEESRLRTLAASDGPLDVPDDQRALAAAPPSSTESRADRRQRRQALGAVAQADR